MSKRQDSGAKIRHEPKEQATVRIYRDVLRRVRKRAKREGLRLADVIEEGLEIWLKSRKLESTIHLRFLCNSLPKELEEQTLAFLAWYAYPRVSPLEEEFRKGFDRVLVAFRQSPEYEACLKRLGTLPKEENNDGLEVMAAG